MTSPRPIHDRLVRLASGQPAAYVKAEPRHDVAHNSEFPLHRPKSFASESLVARQGGQSDVVSGLFFHVFWRRPRNLSRKTRLSLLNSRESCRLMEPSMLHTSSLSSMTTTTSNENFTYLEFFHDSPASSSRPITANSSVHASPMRSLTSASGGLYVSAPGKIILFGEHAVVYGRTAVAGSIDLRTYVSLFTSADGRIYLSLPDLGVEKTWMLKDLLKAGERLAAECPLDDGSPPSLEVLVPIARRLSGSCEDQCGVQHLAILAFWYLLLGVVQRKRDLLAVKVTVRFKLPSCVGLGSSGAYCVCVATALLQTAGLIPAPSIPTDDEGSLTWDDHHLDMIRKWSAAAESLIHGRASGLDAAVCTYGGVACFKPGTRIQHLRNLPDLRVILVNSKVERNTSRMVQTVKERLKRFPDVVEGIFNSIDAISRDATRILHRPLEENGDSEKLVNGGGGTPVPPGAPCSDYDHHTLQPHGHSGAGSVRSGSVNSYVAGGKRGSSASAVSGTSIGCSGTPEKHEKGELTDTYSKLNDLCRINNQLLIALGVGHPKIDQICTLLARYGIHPKMTGAGGGGSVFAFLKPDTSTTVLTMIKDELTKLDYELWQPPLGGPGVVCHAGKPDLFNVPIASLTTPSTTTAASSESSSHSTPSSSHHRHHAKK
uniref:Mevalonate kinase n=1 Tax=Parascaris univalens TaxID=6257 RepID=A0A915AFM4_PARUN